ncbi:group II intron reverse transcriptase/maturase [Lysinibacillus xylanilyticus]|uniref:group II intron reverse transcriptase/maturase n=1 Tax=Lysinibacillus xylanilyticus TaxID=582475 RepID=UPI00380A4449
MESNGLIYLITDRDNLNEAFKKVRRNKGAAGVDAKDIEATRQYLKENKEKIIRQIQTGQYTPQPVRRVEIPKGNGNTRKLGIPTVTDRVIQQAVVQILTPIIDPIFSDYSYGFRPNKSAHQAIAQAQSYMDEGYKFVVDMDLEKFFDRVQHDKLMSLVAGYIKDKPTLKLIRKFLNAGTMANGVVVHSQEGTPQGGPLSPLLSNILLHELDKELEKRGHRFVRYADDCNIYVRSLKAGERVKVGMTTFIEKKLKLKVNEEKSAVGKPSARIFLGVSFYRNKRQTRIYVPKKSKQKFEDKIRRLTNRNRSMRMDERIKYLNYLIQGWGNYFKIGEVGKYAKKMDAHIRRRLRACRWKEWKKITTKYRNLKKLGIRPNDAYRMANTRKGYWRTSNNPIIDRALNNKYWEKQNLKSLSQVILKP